VLFEFDRDAWMQAYANIGSDVVELMQDPAEASDEDDALLMIARSAPRR
jgi:hypothetical protein